VRVGKGEIKKIPFTVVADVETEEGVYDGFVELKIRAGV
jgi:hypothetical protein